MASHNYARVELKNVKYAAFASQETHCFTATVYLDGKKVGTAENDGHGGPTSIHPYALQKTLDEYGKTFPPDTSHGVTINIDGEIIIGELVNDFLAERELKRYLSKKFLYTVAGEKGIYELKSIPAAVMAAELAKGEAAFRVKCRNFKKQPDRILNFMPFNEALALFRAD